MTKKQVELLLELTRTVVIQCEEINPEVAIILDTMAEDVSHEHSAKLLPYCARKKRLVAAAV
jgi:hypothetical protein